MDINWFVNILKNGETYTIQNPDSEPYQVTRPPTANSIKAAELIVQLNNQLQQAYQTIQNLQVQVQKLMDAPQQPPVQTPAQPPETPAAQ